MAFLRTPEPFVPVGLSLDNPVTLIVEQETPSETYSELQVSYFNPRTNSYELLATFRIKFILESGYTVARADVSKVLAGKMQRVRINEVGNYVEQSRQDTSDRFFKYKLHETIQNETFEGYAILANVHSLYEYYLGDIGTLRNLQSTYIDYIITADDVPDIPSLTMVDYNNSDYNSSDYN